MKNWYIYIIECSDQRLYTGITNGIKQHINAHNQGVGAKFTKGRAPVKLKYNEQYNSRSQALKREIQIKSLTRKQKLDIISRE